MAKEKGIVYVCSTVIPGLIKIGKTESDRYENRMKELEDNGYKNCTGLKRQFAIEVEDYDQAERDVHETFRAHQVGNTELFACNIDKVIKTLSHFSGKIIYPVGETKEEIVATANEGAASSELPDGDYTYKVKSQLDKKEYYGVLNVENGILTLKAGANLAELTVDGTNSWITTRKAMGVKPCVLGSDLICSSVSIAANYVCGHEKNGWKAWKDKNGNFIDIYRKK